jgi:hypothetical protein
MTPAPSLSDLIATVESDAATPDPLARLSTASATVAELAEAGDAVLGHFVDQCRRAGHSWTEISGALGVTKQAAHKRFAALAPPSMERFTGRAKAAVEAAATAALALGHRFIGTEHLLLGLYHDEQALSAKILAEAGIERSAVVERIVATTPRGSIEPGEPTYTPLAATALAGALTEALQLGHNYIGTEHLLLALYRDPDGLASQILVEGGFSRDAALAKVVTLLSGFTG